MEGRREGQGADSPFSRSVAAGEEGVWHSDAPRVVQGPEPAISGGLIEGVETGETEGAVGGAELPKVSGQKVARLDYFVMPQPGQLVDVYG